MSNALEDKKWHLRAPGLDCPEDSSIKTGPIIIIIIIIAWKLTKSLEHVNTCKSKRATGLGVNAHVTKEIKVDGGLG